MARRDRNFIAPASALPRVGLADALGGFAEGAQGLARGITDIRSANASRDQAKRASAQREKLQLPLHQFLGAPDAKSLPVQLQPFANAPAWRVLQFMQGIGGSGAGNLLKAPVAPKSGGQAGFVDMFMDQSRPLGSRVGVVGPNNPAPAGAMSFPGVGSNSALLRLQTELREPLRNKAFLLREKINKRLVSGQIDQQTRNQLMTARAILVPMLSINADQLEERGMTIEQQTDLIGSVTTLLSQIAKRQIKQTPPPKKPGTPQPAPAPSAGPQEGGANTPGAQPIQRATNPQTGEVLGLFNTPTGQQWLPIGK